LLIFVFRNSKEQNGLKPQVLSAARFIGNLFHRQLNDSGHSGYEAAFIQFFAYEQRQNKIMTAQLRFANEISQSRGTPKATRAVNQSSHVMESTLW
jgi:hypothetical protein